MKFEITLGFRIVSPLVVGWCMVVDQFRVDKANTADVGCISIIHLSNVNRCLEGRARGGVVWSDAPEISKGKILAESVYCITFR